MSGIMNMLLGARTAIAVDEFFNRVTLLLPGNGTNGAQNNTFLDSSTNNFTITRNGNTTQGTFTPFSQTGWSNYFDGTDDYFTVPYSTTNFDWFTSSTDFTFEAWVYPTTLTGWAYSTSFPTLIGNMQATGPTNYWSFGPLGNGTVSLFYYTGSVVTVTSTATVNVNQWNHIAFTKTSSGIAIFVNGVGTTATAISGTPLSSTGVTLSIGSGDSTEINGYVSNLRIVKGTAVYSGTSYTVPTAPLTDITNTKLLICQANRFVDSSSVANTLTIGGNPSVQPFSPFLPTAAYSAATVGGSAYFDGSGDYLSVANATALQLSTSVNWCIEAWVYPTTLSGENGIIAKRGGATEWQLNTSSAQVAFYNGSTQYTSGKSLTVNQWQHVACTWDGTTLRFFVNGTQTPTTHTTFSLPASSTNDVNIGTTNTLENWYGYICACRLVKGSAVYTASFTLPTAPLTAITNTSLLLNYTNAGITDATAKNVLETVGNAQISTTQSKFGGSSISFDGTGDWLLIPHTVDQMLGTGAFTIELWVYRNSSGTYGLVGKGTGTTGWLVSLNSSNQVVFTYGSSTITSSGTVSATTWTYIAVVREGTGTNQTKIYINGSNDGTGTVSTDFNQTNAMYVGADRTGGSAFNGYIDDLRITKGQARTVTTTPTAAFAMQ